MKIASLNELLGSYDEFSEKILESDTIDYESFSRAIDKHKSGLDIKKIGKSSQKRDIFSISVGKGRTKVLIFSQMHGDEHTGTGAILDLLNFFTENDRFNDLRELISERLSIIFLPMLNPDGCCSQTRRNALGIDINRDALALQSPEAKILKRLWEESKPRFAFNLHDQSSSYRAGVSGSSAAISFLIPAEDYECSLTQTRKRGMQLIAGLAKFLKPALQNHIGRYNDEYEIRAFGDSFVKWGTSSILIESGRISADQGKKYIRSLNFASLIFGLSEIATGYYEKISYKNYFLIPENRPLMLDLLIRDVLLRKDGTDSRLDLGIRYDDGIACLVEAGDLSTYSSYETLEASAAELMLPDGNIFVPEKEEPANFSVRQSGKTIIEFSEGRRIPLL